uniref:Pyrroline-5-carboxylate reductase 3 n=1 Tax=Geotrypetes seraphini TaxID=260995 RepID=A0A6P8QRV2_GEOSA|nr:pyrroline-5-carboxylate reductase 3 isoform X4 [Geotrypetes seraphini]
MESLGRPLRVGFIGAGKMACAILEGMVLSDQIQATNVLVSAPSDKNLLKFKGCGCMVTHSNEAVVEDCKVVFLATKPHVLPGVLKDISDAVTKEHIIISVAAGITLETLEKVYMFAEALAEGAVKMGMPSDLANKIAAHTLLGAAKMILETGEHPAKLRNDVCTPGGTTIYACHELEKGALRATVMNAVEAGTKRAQDMGKS